MLGWAKWKPEILCATYGGIQNFRFVQSTYVFDIHIFSFFSIWIKMPSWNTNVIVPYRIVLASSCICCTWACAIAVFCATICFSCPMLRMPPRIRKNKKALPNKDSVSWSAVPLLLIVSTFPTGQVECQKRDGCFGCLFTNAAYDMTACHGIPH